MRLQARTLTIGCCTRREIGPVGMEDEASRCAMEAADEIKEGGTEVMPTATPETGGVEAMRTGKGNPLRSVGTAARKATGRASVGRSAPIRIEPVPDPSPLPFHFVKFHVLHVPIVFLFPCYASLF